MYIHRFIIRILVVNLKLHNTNTLTMFYECKEYLSKWLTEMNVNSFKLYNTDLPEYTKSKIDNFINQ